MKKYKSLILITAAFLFFPLLLFFGRTMAQGVQDGLSLAYHAVLPALFPAAVVCALIGALAEALPFPPSVTLWIQSQLCGFPLGIRTVAQGYRRGILTKETAEALSCCCANASPAFLINYVGNGVLGSARAGLFLWLGQGMLSFLIALKLGIFQGERALFIPQKKVPQLIAESIGTAAMGCLSLTGFIAFFSAIAALPHIAQIHPLLEITGGIGRIAPHQLGLAGALIGFSGISVLLQNSGYLSAEGLAIGPMIKGKLFYTVALPFTVRGLWHFPWPTAGFFVLFILFLISFDKHQKRRYNKQERMILTRSVL